jgi:hypothetical protein
VWARDGVWRGGRRAWEAGWVGKLSCVSKGTGEGTLDFAVGVRGWVNVQIFRAQQRPAHRMGRFGHSFWVGWGGWAKRRLGTVLADFPPTAPLTIPLACARCGGRHVSVSLRFCTAEARRLGVDGHVCELQLNLAAFAACLVRTGGGCCGGL